MPKSCIDWPEKVKHLLALILCVSLAGCANDRNSPRAAISRRQSVLTGRFEVPENVGYQIPASLVKFADGVSEDSTLRILDSRAIADDRLVALVLMNVDRGPFSSYSLTNVVLYNLNSNREWARLADRGWGDGANSGVRSFALNDDGSVLTLEVLVAGASGDRSDLVGYQTVTYEIGKATLRQAEKGPLVSLTREEWPIDWAGGVKGPCPIPERVNPADPKGPCKLPVFSSPPGR